jgi:hypothetical protein
MRSALLFALVAVPALGLPMMMAAASAAPRHPAAAKLPAGGPTGPQAKTPGACGAKVLPLVEGNQWTYSQVVAMAPPTDAVKRISPLEAKTIVITVKSVDTSSADTKVTLEEKVTTDLSKDEKKPQLDDHTITTTIVCNAKNKFEISPDSFFFAGEPGGYYGLKLDSFTRSHDTSLKLTNGGIGDQPWREEIVAQWTRTPTDGVQAKLGSGKLELERAFTPQQPEVINTKVGPYKSEKLALVTTGRVTLDNAPPDSAKMELPAGWIATMWLSDGVGVTQVINAYFHQYQLVDAQLK